MHLDRHEAMGTISDRLAKRHVAIFIGNGFTARWWYHKYDQPNCFYMLGSMGLCAAIAAGFSQSASIGVAAIEGDGNALMGLSTLPSTALIARPPFLHIVVDNGIYESTGGQRTLSHRVDFVNLAKSCGYQRTSYAGNINELSKEIDSAFASHESTYLVLNVNPCAETPPRIDLRPHEIAERFSQWHFASRTYAHK